MLFCKPNYLRAEVLDPLADSHCHTKLEIVSGLDIDIDDRKFASYVSNWSLLQEFHFSGHLSAEVWQ